MQTKKTDPELHKHQNKRNQQTMFTNQKSSHAPQTQSGDKISAPQKTDDQPATIPPTHRLRKQMEKPLDHNGSYHRRKPNA